MLRAFINTNVKVSNSIESFFSFERDDSLLLRSFFERFNVNADVADVGGGKKPAKCLMAREDLNVRSYDGYDIDLNELELARQFYTQIVQIDLTKDLSPGFRTYDYVICLNTLEHVQDANVSIRNLSKMLNEGGELYLKLPCRHAMFAKLNLVLPQNLKKTLLHFVYPDKIGDGFKVYYDKSTPNEISTILESNGLDVIEIRLIKWSSYFSFFFPLYVVWRVITFVQNTTIDDYCESFEIIAKKRPFPAASKMETCKSTA